MTNAETKAEYEARMEEKYGRCNDSSCWHLGIAHQKGGQVGRHWMEPGCMVPRCKCQRPGPKLHANYVVKVKDDGAPFNSA